MLGFSYDFFSEAVQQSANRTPPPSRLALAAWYDPSDLSTLFQDVSGTLPVVADGDPVALMLDRSGNGHHLSQATASRRPRYRASGRRRWLESDGVDDTLAVASRLGLSLNPALTVVVGMQEITPVGTVARVFQLGDGVGSPAGAVGNGGYSWRYNNGNEVYAPVLAGVDRVAAWVRPQDGTYADGQMFIDGVESPRTAGGGDTNVPTSTSALFSLFGADSTNSDFANLRLYGIVVGAFSDVAGRQLAEAWMAIKAGVSLP